MQDTGLIYIVHHDPDRAKEMAQALAAATHSEVRVAELQLAPADYADLAAAAETSAVIIDQYLNQQAALGYCGMDVAEHLRRVRPGLPIYLLAGPEEDLRGREALVEEVVPEESFLQRSPLYAVRLLRAMGRYADALSEADRRYRELVARKLDGALAESEDLELAARRAEIELPFAGAAIEHAKAWQLSLREEERLLQSFSTELRDLLSKLSSPPQ